MESARNEPGFHGTSGSAAKPLDAVGAAKPLDAVGAAKPLRAVLVANRGEIALRIVRACRESGLRSVAIFTDVDALAPHVRAADDAVRVSSYLDIDAVVAAALATGADAVHPGYGFLSERAAFAQAVIDAGLTFIGPAAAVIEQMGRKDLARDLALAAGVPVVPLATLDADAAAAGPAEVAFPVLVKAAAGGGGKGMRVVQRAEDLDEAIASARREAQAAFGDDTMLLERYVERGRHVEVQVLADAHGTVVHLFERDCSTQRRHQKVLEEAPAPTITSEVRELVTSSAVALARQVGYQGAGTVEFLLDDATGEAYFLEMNTRLQVEHPVTELVTGLDLVRLQLLVAAGEPLPFGQGEVTLSGHAIEARVYAEDPFGGFLPQAGTATLVRWPERARVDAALESGQVVSTSYDPMLGKVIAHGPDREAARRALVAALDDTAVLGLTTNVGFLRQLAAGEEFRDATIDTAWLDRHTVPEPDLELHRVFAAWAQVYVAGLAVAEGHPFRSDGWRLGGDPAPVPVDLDEPVLVDRHAGRVGEHDVRLISAERHVVVLQVDGRRQQAVVNVDGHQVEVVHRGHRHVFRRPDVFAGPVAAGDGTVRAPMPGSLLEVRVAVGQQVAAGDVLAVMEAMKMELPLTAPLDGRVTEVHAVAGGQVVLGATLFVVADT